MSGDSTILHVSLNRALADGVTGNVYLTSIASALVYGSARPWLVAWGPSLGFHVTRLASRSTRLLADLSPGCSASDSVSIPLSGSYCNGTVTFIPDVVSADAFGATFQSPPHGHGVSHNFTVIFNPPVSSVTLKVFDPTFTGNQMQAFDIHHTSIATVTFAGNQTPGRDDPQTGTISGSIALLDVSAAPADYVAYTMWVKFGSPATLSVVSAAGPNPSGSFTTIDSESHIGLQAAVSPTTLSPVSWIVTDDSSDFVSTAPPSSVANGTTSSFAVPPQSKSRFVGFKHPMVISQQALSLSVRATVPDPDGRPVVSTNSRTVTQSALDALREEYVELAIKYGVPNPAEFVVPDAHHRNDGDYPNIVIAPSFDAKLDSLAAAWTERPIYQTLNSGFRSPVHNWQHVITTSGSGVAADSYHMYGCAVDIQTFPVLDPNGSSSAADSANARAYWDRLRTVAVSLGFHTEARDPNPANPKAFFSAVGHLHVDNHCR